MSRHLDQNGRPAPRRTTCGLAAIACLITTLASSPAAKAEALPAPVAPAQAKPVDPAPTQSPDPPRRDYSAFVTVGIGLPQLIHASVGWYATPRFALYATGSNVIFNWLVGLGATLHAWAWGGDDWTETPRHSILVDGQVTVNPVLRPLRIYGGGETIGAAVFLDGGYAFIADSGFTVRAQVGAILYEDNGFAGAPNFKGSIGWTF